MTDRYYVERKPDVFEDVGAATIGINHGSLIFTDADDQLVVAYATGQWITVVPEGD